MEADLCEIFRVKYNNVLKYITIDLPDDESSVNLETLKLKGKYQNESLTFHKKCFHKKLVIKILQ